MFLLEHVAMTTDKVKHKNKENFSTSCRNEQTSFNLPTGFELKPQEVHCSVDNQ